MRATVSLAVTVRKFYRFKSPFSGGGLGFANLLLIWFWLALCYSSLSLATTNSPVVVTPQVSVSYTGHTLNRSTNTYDTQATLTNQSSIAIQTPIQLAISNISQSSVTLANRTGVLADGTPYINVPLSDGTLSPAETVKNLLKFNNPKRVSFTFSHSVLGVLAAANHPPIANAGSDTSAPIGQAVTLTGMASSDEDGDTLSYHWRLAEKPANSNAQLTPTNTLQTQLTVDRKGDYRIELIVNDGQTDSQPAYVTVSTENSKPVAKAGDDQTVKVKQTAFLDGTNSSDIDSDPLTYKWELLAKPGTSTTTLLNPDTQTPNLTPDLPGSYTVQLTVNDGILDSLSDQLIVSTENSKPIANAGADQTATVGDAVILDGSQSSDIDNDPLSYDWSILNKPANSNPNLQYHDQIKAILTPDLPGDYVAQLIVNDSKLNSDPATSLVTVSAKPMVNHNPQITSSPLTTATVGNLYSYILQASDADNDTLSYALTTFPSGMTVNSQSGLISWAPNTNQAGSQSVSVTVTDGKGGSDSQSFSINVSDVAQATVPNLVDQNRADAINAIQQAKLNLGSLSFQHSNKADGKVISQSVTAGSVVKLGTAVNLTISIGPDNGLPPNPATVAPILDPTIAHNVYDSTQFLYTGSNPIQTGVAANTIELKRAAVMRGRVLDKQNNPLSGVSISIKDHPEFGQTLSRADGWFDMVVNGGGYLTIDYKKTGLLPAQRQLNVPWQDFAISDDVVMIGLDAQVTEIALNGSNQNMQIAQGSVVTDKDGSRQATVLFPQGTTATMTLANGSTQSLNTLHFRATEYTVGENGPKTMPAPLPPTSGYTYAVELSADEAISVGAKDVQFNQPVPFYVDNFIGFPVGMIVPVGWYDSQKGAWIPSDNGRVIKIVSETAGLANVDSDGDGQSDNALNLDEAERERLAQVYEPGKSLWRTPIKHLTPWDKNLGRLLPRDAKRPNSPQPKTEKPENNPDCVTGSIIECQNQNLRESVPIVGTSFSLNYSSDRTSGHKVSVSSKIVLSDKNIPNSLKRIDLKIDIAGKRFEKSYAPQADLQDIFSWDGKDAFSRPFIGTAEAKVNISYVYDSVYASPTELIEAADSPRFALSSRIPTNVLARSEFENIQQLNTKVNTFPNFLGTEWSLNQHHRYDPVGRNLYFGSGDRRLADEMRIIETVAGVVNGNENALDDNIPATSASVGAVRHVLVAPDESYYISTANASGDVIRWVNRDGIIKTIVGTGVRGFSGDGGPAVNAQIRSAGGMALSADGSLYFADGSNSRVRKVSRDGTITTVAGNGNAGFSGDGKSATSASLNFPSDVAVASDGSIYIADSRNRRIRKVGTDGIINTIAGTGAEGHSGDGGDALLAKLQPAYLAVNKAGDIFVTDTTNERVRRIDATGIISTVAGNGSQVEKCGETSVGRLAINQRLCLPRGIGFDANDKLFIADSGGRRVWAVDTDGTISAVAGNGKEAFPILQVGDNGSATVANINYPEDVAIGPSSHVYVADSGTLRVRRIRPIAPEFSNTDLVIPSSDGLEIYQFDHSGRHLKTINSLTGGVKFEFSYTSKGLLNSVKDGDGNETVLERDSVGNLTTIAAPFGQHTRLAVNTNGFLTSLTNPAGESFRMGYSDEGLLQKLTTPNGHTSSFEYDTSGRLLKDSDPESGFTALSRTELSSITNSYEVKRSTALGRNTIHRVEDLSNGNQRATTISPDNISTTKFQFSNGNETAIAPDGSQLELISGPDPRFEMEAPIAQSTRETTGGISKLSLMNRFVSLVDPMNLLSIATLRDTITVNGRQSIQEFDGTNRSLKFTSAGGRQQRSTLDMQGRITETRITGLEPIFNSYDAHGRLSSIRQGSAAAERLISFAYNPQGYLASVTDPLGRSIAYDYDLSGRVTKQTLPNGNGILFDYDANGNLTSLTPPGQPAHLFSYDKIDQQQQYSPPEVGAGSNSTRYHFNLDKQLTQVSRPDGLTLGYSYDAAGRLNKLSIPDGDLSYTFDNATGKLIGIDTPAGDGLDYGYAGALLTAVNWSGVVSGKVGFAYDNDFRVKTVSLNDADAIAYQYDADSLLSKAGTLSLTRSADNGLLTGSSLGKLNDSFSYNNFGELGQYAANYDGTDLLKIVYSRDKLGRITRKQETRGVFNAVYDYAYDTAGRLAEVKRNDVVQAKYSYDANGNRVQYQGSNTINATYDAQDRLLTYGNASYSYTANGELKSKTVGAAVTQYQYDVLGNLKQVKLSGGGQIDYVIDGQNRRIGKKINGVLRQAFLWQDQLKPIAELDGNGNLISRFVYATHVNVPDYMLKGGETYRLVTDHLGSPRLVVRVSDGNVMQRMEYDEFGRVLEDTNPGFQPFGFAGGLYDRETGLVRFGARDYDGVTGRWLVKDPIKFEGESANVYTYSNSDSINFIDFNGLRSSWWSNFWNPHSEFWRRRFEPMDTRHCVTAECAAGLLPAPSENRTESEVRAGQCRLVCQLISGPPMTACNYALGGGLFGAAVSTVTRISVCSWICN